MESQELLPHSGRAEFRGNSYTTLAPNEYLLIDKSGQCEIPKHAIPAGQGLGGQIPKLLSLWPSKLPLDHQEITYPFASVLAVRVPYPGYPLHAGPGRCPLLFQSFLSTVGIARLPMRPHSDRGITWHGGHSPSTWLLLGVQVSEPRMLSVFLQLAASSLGDYREPASPS